MDQITDKYLAASEEPDDVLPLRLPVRIITYAWGAKYIDELLALTVPALLAPGNLPYVASVLDCEVIILTEESAFAKILTNEAAQRIRDLCPLRLVSLDDLISRADAYGIALTHVLHRGFSDLGSAVTDHWLLFLNADFILADGSLRNLVRYLAGGERFVVSPSYCVNSEAVMPDLLERVDPETKQLVIAPRDMAALILEHRHNTIRGKTVNQPAFSARHMDQFYWLVDKNTLIGHQMPIAVVGMRPERHVTQPNSYWDHGLMLEFFPNTEPFVIADSDEFLMLELRGQQVAQGEIRTGWPTPKEIARNTIWFLTDYQRDMAKHPLTLHAGELPASIDGARASLRAFVDSVLAHVPKHLPSHIDHAQWHFHWRGFNVVKHNLMSLRLGVMTETQEPPPNLSKIDAVWWRLDGLTKSHARRRTDLVKLIERQRATIDAMLAKIDDRRWVDIGERLARELEAIAPTRDVQAARTTGNSAVQWRPDERKPAVASSDVEDPWVAPLVASSQAWATSELLGKRRILLQALEFAERRGQDELRLLEAEFEVARRPLQLEYERLLGRQLTPMTMPQVVVTEGSQAQPEPAAGLVMKQAHRLYRAGFGKVPHVRPLHPYWAPMRHLVRIVSEAVANGARNVLVVVGSEPLADDIADHLPGLHARVALPDVIGGNLDKAFDENPQFDLCICSMGEADLSQFVPVVKSVTPCMRKGGKVVGFHPNFDRNPQHVRTLTVPQRLLDDPSCGRVYYAGSGASAGVIRRLRRLGSRTGVVGKARAMSGLLLLTPQSLLANMREALSKEPSPEECTSITIEMTF